jgi:predicted DNA-binding transcriptional regulator YafY
VYFPATRVLTVLELLQSRGRVSGAELAARLEVNTRTVRRYITMLQDLGIPVESERGRYGAYRLRPGFKLPPLMFSEDEALAVTLGLLAGRKLGLTGTSVAAEGALAKIERVLPPALRERIQALQEALVLDFAIQGQRPSEDALITLGTCAQQCRRARLRYRTWGGTLSEREIDPYGLVYRSGYWYTVGYCHLRQDIRVFRLDRVLSAEEGNATFVRPDHFDCLTYVVEAIAHTPAPWEIEVLLHTTLAEARHQLPPALATLEETPAGVLLHGYMHDLDWAAYILAGLQCDLSVRRPPELRAALQRLATRISRQLTEAEPPSETTP